jgi:hypothetical protein
MNLRSATGGRQRRVAVGLALMFFAPLGLSFYLYYGHGHWLPRGRVNAGDLIEPPRPLPELALPLTANEGGAGGGAGTTNPQFLKGKWTFLYVQRGTCDAECLRHLYDTRQVRIALDREMTRVQRVFIGDADCCDAQELRAAHPDLILIRSSPDDAPLLALLPGSASTPSSQDARDFRRIYLVDPLGNLMMSYAADAKPKGMLEDMKRLLRLSSIG